MHQQHDVYTRWSQEMRRKEFFHAGQRVGVAVSGGPDSVLLLHFMHTLAREAGLTLAAVHFNHRLRGTESDGDEASVRELAGSLQMEYLRSEADVGGAARERRGNLEAVARELRYRFFFSLIDQGRLDCVATAHTANDQAETVLMRLLRGTGTRGLGGIYPVLEGKVVRPFLGLTRAEVMQEIAARRLPYRVDSSNLDTRLRRNKIRRELLPLLAKEYNPEIIPLLNQLADRARDDEASLERWARDRAHPWRRREGREERIPIRALLEFPPALARRVLRQMVQMVRGSSPGLAHSHIESLRRFAAEAQSGKILNLPGGVVARKEFSWLVVGPTAGEPGGREFSYPVTFPGELPVREVGCTFRFKILNHDDPGKAYNHMRFEGLDPQELGGELVLRNWRAGDSFCPIGSQRVRKLKELFRERKIPEIRRKGWPVLLCAGRIVWVRGFPPARDVAATDQTQRMLIVEEEPTRPSPAARKKPI
ncbi:MAG: tRNA lysidine(34) synthetase TilS [Terriglobia bacterium]|jgi:tRNA(Ile)-lysidine synthase